MDQANGRQPVFTVATKQTEHFAKVWKTPGGLTLPMSPMSIKFATDFANIVLKSFIHKCQEDAAAAKQAQKPALQGHQVHPPQVSTTVEAV